MLKIKRLSRSAGLLAGIFGAVSVAGAGPLDRYLEKLHGDDGHLEYAPEAQGGKAKLFYNNLDERREINIDLMKVRRGQALFDTKKHRDELASGGRGPLMVGIPQGRETFVEDRGFLISQREISNEEYARFAKATGRDFTYRGGGDDPVTGLGLRDMYGYIAWLSMQTGMEYALPEMRDMYDVHLSQYERGFFGGYKNKISIKGLYNDVAEQVVHRGHKFQRNVPDDADIFTDKWGADFDGYRMDYDGRYKSGIVVRKFGPAGADSLGYKVGEFILVSYAAMAGLGWPPGYNPFEPRPNTMKYRLFEPLDAADASQYRVLRSASDFYYAFLDRKHFKDFAESIIDSGARRPHIRELFEDNNLKDKKGYFFWAAERHGQMDGNFYQRDHDRPMRDFTAEDWSNRMLDPDRRRNVGFRVVSPVLPTKRMAIELPWMAAMCLHPKEQKQPTMHKLIFKQKPFRANEQIYHSP